MQVLNCQKCFCVSFGWLSHVSPDQTSQRSEVSISAKSEPSSGCAGGHWSIREVNTWQWIILNKQNSLSWIKLGGGFQAELIILLLSLQSIHLGEMGWPSGWPSHLATWPTGHLCTWYEPGLPPGHRCTTGKILPSSTSSWLFCIPAHVRFEA